MDCLTCVDLEHAFEFRLSKYIEARSAAYYRVSTELAAKKNVDMERARNDLDEHRLICLSPLRRDRLDKGPSERIPEPLSRLQGQKPRGKWLPLPMTPKVRVGTILIEERPLCSSAALP